MNLKAITIGIIGLFFVSILFMSWEDVEPGEEGFLFSPYGDGVIHNNSYNEGTYFVAPWKEIITYNILQQSKTYQSTVMDVNGTDIAVEVAINFSARKGKTSRLHLKHGIGYIQFIDDKVKGAIKDVIGRYTYQEVYSSKREVLEGEIEEILKEDFKGNYIVFHYVEIADVNLPTNIAKEITVKETQKQTNKTAKLKKEEEEYLANAKIEKARGTAESLIINSKAEAEAIAIKQKQLSRSPQYIEYMKAKKWDGSYGTGNVYGGGVSLWKSVK